MGLCIFQSRIQRRTKLSLGLAYWVNIKSLHEAVRRFKKCFGGQENKILASGCLIFNFLSFFFYFNFYLLCTSDRSGLWSTGCRVVCRILGVKNENHNPMHFPLGQDHEGGFSWSCSERGATVFIVSVLK